MITSSASATTKRETLPPSEWEKLPPFPKILLGDNIPWINTTEYGVCPGCKNKPLTPDMYCLRCDRWGRDELNHVEVIVHPHHQPAMMSTLRERVNKIRQGRRRRAP